MYGVNVLSYEMFSNLFHTTYSHDRSFNTMKLNNSPVCQGLDRADLSTSMKFGTDVD